MEFGRFEGLGRRQAIHSNCIYMMQMYGYICFSGFTVALGLLPAVLNAPCSLGIKACWFGHIYAKCLILLILDIVPKHSFKIYLSFIHIDIEFCICVLGTYSISSSIFLYLSFLPFFLSFCLPSFCLPLLLSFLPPATLLTFMLYLLQCLRLASQVETCILVVVQWDHKVPLGSEGDSFRFGHEVSHLQGQMLHYWTTFQATYTLVFLHLLSNPRSMQTFVFHLRDIPSSVPGLLPIQYCIRGEVQLMMLRRAFDTRD